MPSFTRKSYGRPSASTSCFSAASGSCSQGTHASPRTCRSPQSSRSACHASAVMLAAGETIHSSPECNRRTDRHRSTCYSRSGPKRQRRGRGHPRSRALDHAVANLPDGLAMPAAWASKRLLRGRLGSLTWYAESFPCIIAHPDRIGKELGMSDIPRSTASNHNSASKQARQKEKPDSPPESSEERGSYLSCASCMLLSSI